MPSIFQKAFSRLRSPTKAYYPTTGGGLLLTSMFGSNVDIPNGKGGAAIAYASNIAVQRAVQVRAQAVGALKWRIVDKDGEEVDSSESDGRTLIGKALQDAFMRSGNSLFYQWELGTCLYGEAFLELTFNSAGVPRRLTWLNPLWVTVRNTGAKITGYLYTEEGVSINYDPDEILFYRLYNPLSTLRGLSPVETALDEVRIDDNFKRFLRAFYRNDTRGGMVIKPPNGAGTFTERQISELRLINQQTQGTDNAGRGVIIPWQADVVTIDPADLSKNDSVVREIKFRIYTALGVSPSIAGDSDSTRYQQSAQERPNFYINTIYPRAAEIADFVNSRLVPLFEPDSGYWFEFDTSAYATMDDARSQNLEQARLGYQAGLMTMNEAREAYGLDTLPDGDVILKPPSEAQTIDDGIDWTLPDYNLSRNVPMPYPANAPIADVPMTDKAHTADTPAKYRHIDFSLPDGVRVAAKRALGWIDEGKAGDGFTDVGRKRAADLARADYIPSPETVRRMNSYFSRHESDKQASGFSAGGEGYPSAGRVAWDAWGGDVGQSYARARVEQMNAADEKDPNKSALDELATFRKFALKNGAIKAQRFEAKHIPPPIVASIKKRLQDDPASARQIFDDAADELATAASEVSEILDDTAIAQTLAMLASLSERYPDLGFDELLGGADELPD